MVKMAGQQNQYSPRYPSLLVTLKHKPDDRSLADAFCSPRVRRPKDNHYAPPSPYQPKNVYFTGAPRYSAQQPVARRPKQPFHNSTERIHHPYPPQPIRPLMEIKDNAFPLHNDTEYDFDDDESEKGAKQRAQYRNRKAELDWDHAFDLDLIDLYTTPIDTDSHSLTSTISSTDTSFSSF